MIYVRLVRIIVFFITLCLLVAYVGITFSNRALFGNGSGKSIYGINSIFEM